MVVVYCSNAAATKQPRAVMRAALALEGGVMW